MYVPALRKQRLRSSPRVTWMGWDRVGLNEASWSCVGPQGSTFCLLGLCRDPGCGPALQDVPARVQAPLFTANHGSSEGFGRLTDGWFDFFFSLYFHSSLRFPHMDPGWINSAFSILELGRL